LLNAPGSILETARYYEQEGLLAPPSRTASGYRKFAEVAVDRLEFVKRAKALGFSLGEIRDLLVIQDGHADACVGVRDLVLKKLAIVRDKKAEITERSQNSETCPVLKQMGG
jgi:MerR family transcriptional regulator, copper efflux regulator